MDSQHRDELEELLCLIFEHLQRGEMELAETETKKFCLYIQKRSDLIEDVEEKRVYLEESIAMLNEVIERMSQEKRSTREQLLKIQRKQSSIKKYNEFK
ncbi:hypothetical protein BB427_06365 [Pseudoalteromonas sp. BMB]|uniref:hypothetical protein n=1 Tax=Pseudoalteromonas sp. BMB TaxID=1874619 RepID=UPI00083E4FC3|nr:hypothetical protein [Pseudoalteromonas sp. BMB]ODB44302.1 hypothetical protein BB427_06365 [Pseudoalteromonas sp. BMB]